MSNTTRPSTKGIGCAVLFLAPFAAFGIAMAVLTAWCLVDWVRMQSWVETPARLVALDLKGDDTDRIDAQYEYTFAGQKHTGTRVALHSGSDNIGRYQQRQFKRLEQAKLAGKKVTAYVNPTNPAEAVLLRDLRPEMVVFKGVFALVFGLIGVGGMVGIRLINRDTKREIALADKYPDEPWRWRQDWSEGVITSSASGGALVITLIAGIWNLGTWSVVVIMFLDGEAPSPAAIGAVLLFAAVGMAMMVWAVMCLVRWLRFPRATFRMASTPGVVGGQLAGVIVLPGEVRPAEGFRTTLTCTTKVTSDSDSDPKVLWVDERIIVRTLDAENHTQTAVPVAFTVPSDALPSDPHAKASVHWKLGIKAELPGPDLAFDFEVPVFRTPESRDDVVPQGEPLTEFERTESLSTLLAAEKIQVDEGSTFDSIVYRVPPARHRGLSISLTLFALIWVAIVIGLFWFGVGFFASVFALIAVVLVPAVIHTWLAWSELRITGDQWHYRWGWWPWWFATREFDSSQVQSFVVKQNTRAGATTYGDLVCNLQGGKSFTIARILSSRVAERMWVDELRRRAGLTS